MAFRVPKAGRAWLQENDLGAATLYLLLIDGATWPTFSDDDTMADHPGWDENTSYSEPTRQQWVQGASSEGYMINAPAATFTISTASTIGGIALVTVSTKGSSSGTLIAEMDIPTGTALSRAISQLVYGLMAIRYVSLGG